MKVTELVPMKPEPRICTGFPELHVNEPSTTPETTGGTVEKAHESIFIVVPHVVVLASTALDTGLQEVMPVDFSKSPKVTITLSSGVNAQFAALTELKHIEMVTTRDSDEPVVHDVEHHASTDCPFNDSNEGSGDVVQQGTGGDAFNVTAMKLNRTFCNAISAALFAVD